MEDAARMPIGALVTELVRRLHDVVEDEMLELEPQEDRDERASPDGWVHVFLVPLRLSVSGFCLTLRQALLAGL